MPNIFVLHYNYKMNLKQLIRLIAKIYQHKVGNILLLNGTLCISSKNEIFMLNFPSQVLK